MSGNLYGADIEQLRALASVFEDKSNQLSSAVQVIAGSVDQIPWFGPSGEMFREEWEVSHAPGLRDAASALVSAADALVRNADAQDETSNDDGGIVGGPYPGDNPFAGAEAGATGTADGGGWGDWLNDLVGETGWWASVAGATEFAAETAYRYGAGLWGLADDIPAGFGWAGKAIGWAGIALGGWTIGQGIAEGDWWKVGDGAITAGLGLGAVLAGAALLSNPVGWAILGAGAAWAVADIFIDGNITEAAWNGISNAGEWAWDTAGDAADWVGDTAGDAWDGATDVAGDIYDAGGDLLEGAGDFISDITPW
ncbi:hypothetical protein GCM10027059_35580 [Myceligenerans halotolerans]